MTRVRKKSAPDENTTIYTLLSVCSLLGEEAAGLDDDYDHDEAVENGLGPSAGQISQSQSLDHAHHNGGQDAALDVALTGKQHQNRQPYILYSQ